MKTNHSIATLLLLLSLGMTSCSTYYRMTSRIDTNGSMHREVYARGDSAFIAGDKTHNPFLFQLDTDWQIVNLDSTLKFNFWGEEEKLNVKACRNIPLINGEYFSISNGKEQMSSLAIPTEQLKKRFKWFYTYYIYTATYKELPDKGPVPLDKYLNKETGKFELAESNPLVYVHGGYFDLGTKIGKFGWSVEKKKVWSCSLFI